MSGEAGNEGPESQHPPSGFPFHAASARQKRRHNWKDCPANVQVLELS
jgi:hypothetical protein